MLPVDSPPRPAIYDFLPDSPTHSVIHDSRPGSPAPKFATTDASPSPSPSSFSLVSPETPLEPADDSIIFEIEGRLVTLPRNFFERNANYFRAISTNANPRSDTGHASTKDLGVTRKIGVKEFLGYLFPVIPQPVEHASAEIIPAVESQKSPLCDFDTAIFEVENLQFVILKHHFIQSTISDALGSEWTLDEGPMKLDGVVKSDFEALWKLLYSLPGITLSQVEWESVLKLTTKWKMLALRKRAVGQLSVSSWPASKRILLGRECGIVEWLRSGYSALGSKIKPLSMSDSRILGLENTLLLSQQVRRPYRHQLSGEYIVPLDIDLSLRRAIDDALEPPLASQMQSKFNDKVERILFAQSLGDSEWLYAAYGDLAKREDDITVAEAERLGAETTLSICRLRERLDYQNGARPYIVDIGRHVDSVFQKELADVRQAGAAYVYTEEGAPGLKKKKKK